MNKAIRYIFPHFILAIFVVFPICVALSSYNRPMHVLVSWWCNRLGAVEPDEIAFATGVFAAMTLAAAIVFAWTFVMQIFKMADGAG